MSPAQMETNDEPRTDNFMAHEHGTQSNSEFTHSQMGLSQSMLEQPEVRQQRNQPRKAHNVAKHARQKEQQKCLNAELSRECPWNEISSTCLLPFPTQS
ncbi:hypothetical protein O181_088801 [Austropuccinia psidii MF-1]|uniref:Uncharacterized protein n=1 Tax=Austropuccinia psidii MF-1 TaxID=1389203 RepID=A0A9Q3IS89_9BASI|nr:hypothetical protein [Austropuccinia psidii MF-1]